MARAKAAGATSASFPRMLWLGIYKRAKRGLTRIGTFGEELPNIENRIELVSDKDEFGMPLAKIIHSYDKDAEAVWNANFEDGLKIAEATGAKDVWSASGNIPTIHLMGGTIMGTEAGNSVVNSYGQTHGSRTYMWLGPESLRPAARPTRPIRFLLSRYAVPNNSPRRGIPSLVKVKARNVCRRGAVASKGR
jgi:hypothetical protein